MDRRVCCVCVSQSVNSCLEIRNTQNQKQSSKTLETKSWWKNEVHWHVNSDEIYNRNQCVSKKKKYIYIYIYIYYIIMEFFSIIVSHVNSLAKYHYKPLERTCKNLESCEQLYSVILPNLFVNIYLHIQGWIPYNCTLIRVMFSSILSRKWK